MSLRSASGRLWERPRITGLSNICFILRNYLSSPGPREIFRQSQSTDASGISNESHEHLVFDHRFAPAYASKARRISYLTKNSRIFDQII
jgi:hypothetical protein